MSAELLENRLLLSTTNLSPSDDAYVRDGSYNTTNFGSDTQLVVKTDTGSGFTRQSFIKFSLSSLTAGAGIVSADLKLYGDDSSNSETVYVDADNTGSTSWSEGTITWNTKPSYSSPYLDQEVLSSTTNAWYDWTVTSYARTQFAASSPVSLALYGDTNTNSGGFFSSKEATDSSKRPYLAVVTLLAPTGPSATAASSSQVNVSWTDASDNEDGFKVQRSIDGGTTWSTLTTTAANATSYADTTVSASTTYKYRVLSTKTSVVDSSPTSAVTVTTPAAGVTSTLAATDDTFVRDGTFDTTANGSSTTFLTKNTTTANGGFNRNIYVKFDSTTIDGTASSAKIRLYGAAISGTESATVSAYSVSDTTWSEGTLTWANQPSHGSSVASVTMSSATAAWYEWDVTSYVNTQRGLGNKVVAFMIQSGTTTNTGYQFNSKENGTNPPQFQVIWPGTPTAPSGLTATASGTTVNLAWTDNSGSETGIKIERATDSGFTTNDSIISTTAANATSYADTGLTVSTTYYYRIRATNSNGDSSNSSSASATTTASTPTAPSGLTATAVTGGQINLAWTDNSSNETGFKVERATDSAFTTNDSIITTTAANATSYSDASTTPGTTYYYRVRATNSGGDSANTTAASVTLSTAPTAPSDLAAYAVSGSEIDLAWTDNSSTETGFQVQRATNSTFTTGLTTLATTAANATSYNDTSVSDQTTYYYRVRAVNTGGSSAYSSSASDTANDAPTITTAASASPSPVTGTTTTLSVAATDDGGSGNLTYTWSTTSDVDFSSANGTSSGNSTVVTFGAAGTYAFDVIVSDAQGFIAVDSVSVTVNQTLTSVGFGTFPGNNGGTLNLNLAVSNSFAATGFDQWGVAMSTQPTFTYSLSGSGSINTSTGEFTAATGQHSRSTITATSGTKSATYLLAVGHLVGTVFGDPNENGVQDSNELGLDGFDVYYKDLPSTVLSSDVTDAFGDYVLDDTPSASCGGVVVDTKAGWTHTSGNGYDQGKAILTGIRVDDNNSSAYETVSGHTLWITRSTTGSDSIHLSASVQDSNAAFAHLLYKVLNFDGTTSIAGTVPSIGVDVFLSHPYSKVISGIDNGDGVLEPQEVTQTMLVAEDTPTCTTDLPNNVLTIARGAGRTYVTVHVTGTNSGQPLPNRRLRASSAATHLVTAVVNNDTTVVNNPTTDANGNIKVMVVAPFSEDAGHYRCELTVDGKICGVFNIVVTNN